LEFLAGTGTVFGAQSPIAAAVAESGHRQVSPLFRVRGEGLPHDEREARPSKLDQYKQYIAERVKAAAPEWIPATVLLRELRALG